MKTINKQSVQSAAVTAVKVIVYPAHLVAQTTADLLNIGQAKAINLIDGTEIYESMMNQQSWTQQQQATVVEKAMTIREKMQEQRLFNRQQDIDKLKSKLDKLEGVEHIDSTEPTATNTEAPAVTTEPIAVPTPPNMVIEPPKEDTTGEAVPFVPINQRKPKAKDVPLMTPKE
jgi:hypothetical protein